MRYWEILEAIYKNKKKQLMDSLRSDTEQALNEEYDNVIIDRDGNYFDSRRPRLCLRHLRKLRKYQDKVKKEKKEHLEFLPTMYSQKNAMTSKQIVDLEKTRMDNETKLSIEKIKAGK